MEAPATVHIATIRASWVGVLIFLAASSVAQDTRAQHGVSRNRIVFGQSAALSGPAALLGEGMRQGILAAFAEANRNGGVHGRRLELLTYDDGYEPLRAIDNTTRLVDADSVFALLGGVGTPTSRASVPIAAEAGVPFVGAFTGSSFLRDPGLENVVNIRASYDQEAERGVEYLTTRRGFSRIAVLFQDDSFGRAGLRGIEQALADRGLQTVADATYKRNTVAVKRAILDIRDARPQAVFIVGAYEPAAEFIRVSRRIGFRPTFITLSFVGGAALMRELGGDGAGVLVTQVMPLYTDRSIPLVDQFREAISTWSSDAQPGFVTLEGYVTGRFVVEVLRALGPDPTRKGFLAAVESNTVNRLGGLDLEYGPDDNQGSDQVYVTRIASGGAFAVLE